MIIPSQIELAETHKRISGLINKTPVLTSHFLNKIYNADLFFKCENFQKVGAFKIRGAINTLLSLPTEKLVNGVATHSSGNHAAALALAARLLKSEAFIVMPKTAPEIKKKAVKGYGGKITFCEPTLEARETTCNRLVEETGAYFVHPYNNIDIVKGQATCAKEIFDSEFKLDYLIAPVGGGGLLSGSALSAFYYSPSTKVIGAEPKGADDAFRSIRDNKIYPSINPKTVADGLLTSLGEITFELIKKYVDEIITVGEDSIIRAMRDIWERMKIVIEPSAAVPLAVVLENQEKFKNKSIGVILSGGNIDLDNFNWNSN
ncbi:MAG: pyridoxal-phosphate dependent enzyme [Melioribacteraceae bacterium]|nr:pyridoxal-phosphate dependent enzyme [Melioribacteraceae bacterium]